MDAEALLWTKIASIGQVAGAIATLAAVIVSLWLAARGRQVKLRVTAGIRLLFAGDGTPETKLVAIRIENLSDRAVRISTLGWSSGWFRRGPKFLRKQVAVQVFSPGSAQPPIDLAPGTDALFYSFASNFEGDKAEDTAEFFGRRLFGKRRPANIRAIVSVVGTKDIRRGVERGLASFLVNDD